MLVTVATTPGFARPSRRIGRQGAGKATFARERLAGTHVVVARDGEREVLIAVPESRIGELKKAGAGVEGALKTKQLVAGFGLDAHRQDDGAKLQVGHAAIHHVAEKGFGLFDREGLGAFRPAADFLDEGSV